MAKHKVLHYKIRVGHSPETAFVAVEPSGGTWVGRELSFPMATVAIDMLRNESPVYLVTPPGSGWYITTDAEEPGEGE